MIKNRVCVVDLETTSLNRETTQVIQIGAAIVDLTKLEIVDEFESMLRALDMDAVEDSALARNKKSREEIQNAPHPEEVWDRFVRFVRKWSLNGSSSPSSAPIAAGHNSQNFDIPILNRLAIQYGTTRLDKKSGEIRPNLFHDRIFFDTMQLMSYWAWNLENPRFYGLDSLRKYMRMGAESIAGGHDALNDVRDTAALLIRLLTLSKTVAPRVQFEGCFDPEFLAAKAAERQARKEREAEKAAERAARGGRR